VARAKVATATKAAAESIYETPPGGGKIHRRTAGKWSDMPGLATYIIRGLLSSCCLSELELEYDMMKYKF